MSKKNPIKLIKKKMKIYFFWQFSDANALWLHYKEKSRDCVRTRREMNKRGLGCPHATITRSCFCKENSKNQSSCKAGNNDIPTSLSFVISTWAPQQFPPSIYLSWTSPPLISLPPFFPINLPNNWCCGSSTLVKVTSSLKILFLSLNWIYWIF